MKRIGVLTSGGDTPGMNAAIRAVFKTGVDIDLQVMGIYHGYKGLIEGRVGYLAHADVESKMHKGGTILRTARSEEFKTEGGIEKAISVLRAYEIEGLIVIGGDGSFKGADALSKRGIPVIVMEPLRGGHLCELSDSQHDLLQSLRPGVTPSEWAFRWVQGVPGVAVVLSGMSNAEQLRENIETFAEEKPLNGEELAAINQIAHEMATAKGLPCTACRYCTSYCPVGLDIPYLIGLYNEHLSRSEGGFLAPMALKALPDDKQPSSCIAYNACHDVCPQGLAIPEFFDEFARAMGQKS